MPSFALPFCLVFAATAANDPPASTPHGRDAGVPAQPAVPPSPKTAAVPSPKPVVSPVAIKPTLPVVAKPAMPTATNPPRPSVATQPAATPRSVSANIALVPPRTEQQPARVVVEEIPASMLGKGRPPHRKPPRLAPAPAEHTEHEDPIEHKNAWSADRYNAVVPPALTLAALRGQLPKAGKEGASEKPVPVAEQGRLEQLAADIEKAREALRQETSRLEILIRTSSNCTQPGGSMPIGEPLLPAAQAPSGTARETSGEQIDSVSKAIKGMKPEQAAAVLARMERGLAAEILRRMKPIDAGAVLGIIKPELAAELATAIATYKPVPAKDKKGVPK